jgi:hypothetical protein
MLWGSLWGTARGADGARRKAGYHIADVEFRGVQHWVGLAMMDAAFCRWALAPCLGVSRGLVTWT